MSTATGCGSPPFVAANLKVIVECSALTSVVSLAGIIEEESRSAARGEQRRSRFALLHPGKAVLSVGVVRSRHGRNR